MEFTIKSGSPEKQRSACVVVGVFDNRKLSLSAELIDRASNGYVSEIIRRGDMEGKLGATLLLHNVRGTLADRVLLVGLGKERDFRDKEFRAAIRAAVKLLNETGSYEAVRLPHRGKGQAARGRVARRARGRRGDGGGLPLRADEERAGRGAPAAAQAHAVGAAALRPHRRRGRRGAGPGDRARHGPRARPRQPARQRLHADVPRRARAGARRGVSRHQGRRCSSARRSRRSAWARSCRSPTAATSRRASSSSSTRQPAKKQKPFVLVGKGITFDTGGISLKPGRRHGPDEVRHVRRGAACSARSARSPS